MNIDWIKAMIIKWNKKYQKLIIVSEIRIIIWFVNKLLINDQINIWINK